MSINFIGILTKPLKLKIFLILIFNLFLLFLPVILLANFMGTENIIFKIVLVITLIILKGYFWTIFQHEIEEDDHSFPGWSYISNFFIGLKAILFSLGSLSVIAVIITALHFLVQYVPDSKIIADVIAIVCIFYWLLMYNPVAMGIFAEKFNVFEGLKISTISEVINGSWLYYLLGGFYMTAYTFIIGMIAWACIIFFGDFYKIYLIVFFAIYLLIVCFSLYAKVFKKVKSEYESHF